MKLKNFLTLKVGSGIILSGNVYNPLINYDWSTTTTSGLRYLKDVGSTPTYNASMYFGRGAYFNGVDQTITVPINATIQTALKRVNGVITINETSQTLTNYVISGLGVHKDYYLFTRLLTTAEKDSYTNTPEAFYAMAQSDSTCVLNMPMCETSSTVRNYKTGTDHPITNYTSSVRTNAKNLQYGLQTCKFVRDSLGVIQSASDYLECDGVGYGDTNTIILGINDFTIETVIYHNQTSTSAWEWIAEFGNSSDKRLVLATQANKIRASLGLWFTDMATSTTNELSTGAAHLVFMREAGKGKLFANGVLDGVSQTVSTDLGSFSMRVGKSGVNYLDTPIRLFKVHNKALTQAEITANYNSYRAKGLLS